MSQEDRYKEQAGDRSRTRDLLITNQLLYQLSYAGYSDDAPNCTLLRPGCQDLFASPNPAVWKAILWPNSLAVPGFDVGQDGPARKRKAQLAEVAPSGWAR